MDFLKNVQEFAFYSTFDRVMLLPMKRAIGLYDELKDIFDYTCESWLRLSPTETTVNDSRVILAAASFLFDNLFVQEDAGTEITKEAASDLGHSFAPNRLSQKATVMRLAMSGDDFSLGDSPLRNYIKWVGESEPDALASYKDDYGKLALVTIEELVNLIVAEEKDCTPLRVSELLFLNITEVFFHAYAALLGPRVKKIDSAPYFLSVAEQNERIRAEIGD